VVSEQDILGAMQLVMERMKLVVEPSGAAGLAAVRTQGFQQYAQQLVRDKQQQPEQEQEQQSGTSNGCSSGGQQLQVGVVLCGGNLDFGGKGFWRPELWQA
jgi:serine racemase